MTTSSPLEGFKGMTQEQIDAGIARGEKKREERNTFLKANNKPLHELVATATFKVKDVVAESYVNAPWAVDMNSRADYNSYLILTVEPTEDCPVRTLKFQGASVACIGDDITAKIPLFLSEKLDVPSTQQQKFETIYNIERAYKAAEEAIELIIRRDGVQLRTEHSAIYQMFQKKS